jgi:hypothetical protein
LPKFNLILLIHAHQPVGNFDSVIERNYQRSYLPFVECLMQRPCVRLGLHYTGPLLEWLEQHHPEFLDQLRAMIRRGQVEIVGGGFYEPILISLPPDDQAAQLRAMRAYLTARFGMAPSGAWLAERVWEPQLPSALSSSDVQYTLVDDSHFLAAGFEPDQLYGDYIAEDRGQTVRLFPGLKLLRYLVPFRPVEETIDFLRGVAANHPGGMAAMGDDCEKFGAWPGTYEHCYVDGWVDRFFAALEASSDWLVSTPPGEYLAEHEPLGRADLPTASYSEMMEWVLPTVARNEFHALTQEFAGRPGVLRFLRGGHWRGFFSKYAESNLLHKKMLYVSDKLHGLAAPALDKKKQEKLDRAHRHLMRAQCNDAYWHGVFGGVYAPHLRTEPWRELVRAEAICADLAPATPQALRLERLDFDADGSEELYVTSQRMAALLKPNDGGTIAALDFRTNGLTLINSLQRRVEAYHALLHEEPQGGDDGHAASIHDRVRAKEKGLARLLRYDRWPRNAFRLLLFPAQRNFQDYQQLRLEEHAELAGGRYLVREALHERISLVCEAPLAAGSSAASQESLRCAKHFSFAHTADGYQVHCAVEITSSAAQARRVQMGIEIVLNLLAPNEPDRYFETATPGGRHPLSWAAAVPASQSNPVRLRVVDLWQDVAATLEAPLANHLWIAPIETVSESEDGFERVYQGSQILLVWPVELSSSSPWRGEVTLTIAPARPAATSQTLNHAVSKSRRDE